MWDFCYPRNVPDHVRLAILEQVCMKAECTRRTAVVYRLPVNVTAKEGKEGEQEDKTHLRLLEIWEGTPVLPSIFDFALQFSLTPDLRRTVQTKVRSVEVDYYLTRYASTTRSGWISHIPTLLLDPVRRCYVPSCLNTHTHTHTLICIARA